MDGQNSVKLDIIGFVYHAADKYRISFDCKLIYKRKLLLPSDLHLGEAHSTWIPLENSVLFELLSSSNLVVFSIEVDIITIVIPPRTERSQHSFLKIWNRCPGHKS